MRLVVGRIGRAHGLTGEVAVEVRTDEPEVRFAPGQVLSGPLGPLTVAKRRWHSGRLLVSFEGVSDRNGAEALHGTELAVEVDASQLPDEPDAFYDHQLVGLRVEFPDGTFAGQVTSVLHLPSQDVLAVATPGDREVLVPFVSEIVPHVDLSAGRIVVAPPGGLFDEVD